MSIIKITYAVLALLLTPVLAMAATPEALTPAQAKAVENIVRELLTKKDPKIVIDAAKAYQITAEAEALTKGKETIKTEAQAIFNDPTSPMAGNPKGDITIVEFFDYSCGYCKKMQSSIIKLIETDKNIRFVFKELPIFGPESEKISKAALASVKQDKYVTFHMALMKTKMRLNEKRIMKLAKKAGLDVNKLKKDMKDPKIESILQANKELATRLGVQGTPAFIIGDVLYPGAMSLAKLKKSIAKARAKKKKS